MIAAFFGVLQRGDSVVIRQVYVGSMLDQKLDDSLMVFTAVAQGRGHFANRLSCPIRTSDGTSEAND